MTTNNINNQELELDETIPENKKSMSNAILLQKEGRIEEKNDIMEQYDRV